MSNIWSMEEDEILELHYNKKSINEIMEMLPIRTKRSIRIRASLKNLTKIDWTDEEILFLKENYLKLNYSKIADKLNRTKSSVQQKARFLGLIKAKPSSWSKKRN